jgi:hypothetical protein
MTQDTTTIDRVRDRYASAARHVQAGGSACCSPTGTADPVTSGLYEDSQVAGLPEQAVMASL